MGIFIDTEGISWLLHLQSKLISKRFHHANPLYFGLQETDRVAAALALGPLKGLEAPSIGPVNLAQASKAH